VAGAVGVMVGVVAMGGSEPPPPPDDWQVSEVTEPQEGIGGLGMSVPAEPVAPVTPISPMLDDQARTRIAAAGLDWGSYEMAVTAAEDLDRASARTWIAKLGEVPEGTAAREELELLRLCADIGEQPVGSVSLEILAWRERYPESRLTRYSQLVEGFNCLEDARQQNANQGEIKDPGNYTLSICAGTLDRLGEHTATDPWVAGRALYEAGYAFKNIDRPPEALAAWSKLATQVPLHPRTSRALYTAGTIAWREDRLDEADAFFTALIEDHPDDNKVRTASYNRSAIAMVGKPAPELVVDHWFGAPTTLADHRGELVVLVFWNEWCDHCHEQIPRAQKIQDRFGEQGVTALLVTKHNKDQTDEKVQAFLTENGATVPCAVEPASQQTSTDYAVYGVPTAAVVGRDGTVVWRNHPNYLTDDKIYALLGM